MDWEKLAAVDVFQLERNESLLDSLYTFLEENELTAAEATHAEPDRLAKIVAVVQRIMKVKGEEAKVAMEELLAQQQQGNSPEGGAPNERALMNQIVQLEREMREKDQVIDGLKERGDSPAPGAMNEARVLRQENEDLRLELGEVKRRLDHERGETDRLSGEAAAERVRTRQLEREVDQLRNDLEEYRKLMKSHGDGVGGVGGASMLRAGEREYRERLRNKDLEIAEQLDKIEDLLNVRDDLERQRQELTEELGRAEEQKIASLRETEEVRQALIEADHHRSELETRTSLLEGQVSDLQECLHKKTRAEQQTHVEILQKTREWESTLSAKESQLAECQELLQRLQSQLTEAGRDSNRAAVIRLKKQLQERDWEVSELQEEMACGATALEELSAQLEEERQRSNPTIVNTALQKALESARVEGEGLKQALEQERGRRQECEASAVEKEVELTQALCRLGEYERGVYGLREAVLEIKTKKEEIAVRDRDIMELTQQVNSLDRQLNELSEFNEMLCERLGVGEGEDVGFGTWRVKREGERERVREENRSLQREVERLEEEKLALRKRLVDVQLSGAGGSGRDSVDGGDKGGRGGGGERGGGGGGGGESEGGQDETDDAFVAKDDLTPVVAQLRTQVAQLQDECVRERRERERMAAQLREQMTPKAATRSSDGEREKVRGDEMAKELKLMYCRLDSKTIETERLEEEVESLRQAASGFQLVPLPESIPMTSRDVIASLNEHLLHALRAERGKSQECETMRAALEKYQRKFSVIIHQLGILYKEYTDGKREWEREREQVQGQIREMESLKEIEKMRHQELKTLQDQLSSDPDTQKQRMAEASRQVTTLRVNEKILSRRYTLLYEREAALRKENNRLRDDMMMLEKSVTERIGYLQRHKEALQFKLASVQHQISESVAATELEKANRQYGELAVKYQVMLQREASQVAAEQQVERLQVELRTTREQLAVVKEELSREKLKNRSLEHARTPQTETEVLQPAVATSSRLATLEMRELNERQRADLATARNTQLRDSLVQLEQRNTELEGKFASLTERLLLSQNRETDLMEKMADSLTPEERTSLEAEITNLRKSEARLRVEVSQLKEVSDVARQQVVAMETWKKSHDLVMSSLHHQLLDAQTGSDDKAMVGKLQQQITTLQVSESEATRKLEAASVKILQLEASVLRNEQQRDAVAESAFHSRSQSQTKITQLRAIIRALRRQYAGAIPLSEQEKQVELVLGLREKHREVERLRKEARTERDIAKEKLAELELQQANLRELLAALKDPKNATTRLMEWHAKLGEARLHEMKAVRDREKAEGRVIHLEGVITESEKKFSKLEGDLVQVTRDYESSQLSWEQRELELEQQLRWEREKGREGEGKEEATRSTDGRGTKQTLLAQVQLPLATQLSQALADLQQKSQNVAELRRDVMLAVEQVNTLERALKTAQNQLLQKEKELSELKVAKIRSEGVSREEREGHRAELTETQRARRAAEDTVQELQAIIAQKEAQCEKYHRLLQEERSQLHSMTELHKSEVASLVKKLHAQSDSAVLKLKAVSMEAIAMPVVTGATEEQLARLHVLEDLIGQQRVSYEAQLEEVRQASVQAKQVYETSLVRLRQEMGEMKRNRLMEKEMLQTELSRQSTRAIELEQELEVMSGELSAAQEAVKQAPSQTTKSLVEKLRQQLSVKEKQQKALNEALLQVRAELLDATQKALQSHTHQEVTEVNLQRMVQKRTGELEERVQELSSDLDGMRTELEQSRDREAEALRNAEQARETVEQLHLDKQRHKKEEEMWRREREEGRERVTQLEGDLQQTRKVVEQGRTREQRLARELQILQQKSDHKPEVEELQRKLKVLQSRFDRQKQQTDSLRHQHKVLHVGVAPNKPQPVEVIASQVSVKHSSESVLKWEENKKWQRKMDGVRSKLAEKTREAESLLHQVTSLKETLTRANREKNILQGKMKSLQKTISDLEHSRRVSAREVHLQPRVTDGDGSGGGDGYHGNQGGSRGDGSHRDEYVLQKRVFDLEGEVARLKRELTVSREGELQEAQLKNQQLLKSMESLQRQLGQEVSESGQAVTVGERERELETELLETKKENMEMRFDYEQAVLELPRLRALIRDQEKYIETLVKAGETEGNRRNSTKVHPVGVVTGSHTPSVEELQRVISAMRTVVEKLQRENERLRKQEKGGKERKGGRDGEGEGEKVGERLRYQATSSPTKSSYSKIVSENERLRKSLKREMERNEKLNVSLKTAEIHSSRLQGERSQTEEVQPTPPLVADHTHSQEELVEHLRAEVEKKTQMLLEVKKHVREAAEREREQALAVKERDALKEQVQMLRRELDAFDPSFFEEVEDLKFNYQEAVKRNIQYEEQITRLSQQLGGSPPTFHA